MLLNFPETRLSLRILGFLTWTQRFNGFMTTLPHLEVIQTASFCSVRALEGLQLMRTLLRTQAIQESRQLENAVINTGVSFAPNADGKHAKTKWPYPAQFDMPIQCWLGVTIFADSAARSAAGNFLHVPLLGGTTEHESDIFVVGAELLAAGVAVPKLTEIISDLSTQVCPLTLLDS
ncbi:hypothetical protein C0991_004711 [Blastosporella zonata]|nr:hypothetical protein C0991_004711 [Blastosporella zonata]